MIEFITEEEFKQKSISTNQQDKIIFNDKIFKKGPDFSEIHLEEAKNFCDEYSPTNQLCLLVQNRAYFSIWIEQKQKLKKEEKSTQFSQNSVSNIINIACISDRDYLKTTVKVILEKRGYRVIIIDKDNEIIDILKVEKPRLIFIDFELLGIDGYQLYVKLRNLDFLNNTPLIRLINKENLIDKIRAKLKPSNDYIIESFKDKNLIYTLQNILNKESLIPSLNNNAKKQ